MTGVRKLAERTCTACPVCGSGWLVSAHLLSGDVRCPWCAEGVLEPAPCLLEAEPELHRPATVDVETARAALAEWMRPVWLKTPELRPDTLKARLLLIWWPEWLVDATVRGHWSASVGYDYEVESALEHWDGSAWSSREVVETRVRWEPRVGQLERSVDNVPVPALQDHESVCAWVEDSGYQGLEAFASTHEGLIRAPDILPDAGWGEAETQLQRVLAKQCQQAAGGQHVHDFRLQAQYTKPNWTTLLRPVWVTWYADDKGVHHRVWVDGTTGRVSGARLVSYRRTARWTLVLGVFTILCLVCGAGSSLVTAVLFFLLPIPIIGGVLGSLGLILTILFRGLTSSHNEKQLELYPPHGSS